MNQIKAGAVLNYVVLGLNNLVILLYTPYMLRMMGQSEYGLYSLVASIIAYLTIMDFGFGNAIIRFTAKFRTENKVKEQFEMFGMFVILYFLIGVIAFIAGLGLYFNVEVLFGGAMTMEELSKAQLMMLILSFNVAITFPFSIFGSIITAYEDFIFQKIVQIARIILNTFVMIILLQQGYKAIAMVVVQTLFNVATLMLNLYYCKYRLHIQFIFGKFRWAFLKEISIYSFWIFLCIIIDRVYWNSGQFILGMISGTVAVAVFSIAIQIENMYMQFATAISGLFLPKVTSMIAADNNRKAVSDLFMKVGRIQYIVIGFIWVGFIVFGKEFIILWAGYEYIDAYAISIIFITSLLVPSIQTLGITILQARNQMMFRSLTYLIIAIAALFFQILLARTWGGIGCAISIAGALILGQGIIMGIYYHKKQNINIILFWKEIMKISIVPLIMCILALTIKQRFAIMSWSSLLIGIFLFSIIYIPATYIFCMNEYEKSLIPTILKSSKR